MASAVVALGPTLVRAEVDEPAASDETPRLIVLISVDQLGSELFTRMQPTFSGGFRLLLDRGTEFRKAEYRHAKTETAPGHATIATGTHPSRHGIIGNWWLERGDPEELLSVDDEQYDKSPHKLVRSTLGDWLKDHAETAKVIAASAKDRSAILLGGKSADLAVWFDDESGRLVTSPYYAGATWLESFDSRRLADEFFGRMWTPLPVPADELERLEIEEVDRGPREHGFPHASGPLDLAAAEDFYDGLWDSPWLDELIIRLALEVMRTQDLGSDDAVDLLALGFSASDSVGHDWGPNSREQIDVMLRLDRLLGELFDQIDQTVGLGRTIVALTSDHGSVPAPEVRQKRGEKGEAPGAETVQCIQSVGRRLAEAHGVERWLVAGPFLDNDLEKLTGLSRKELELRTAAAAEECPSVARVWTRGELMNGDAGDVTQQLFANSFFADRSPDFLIQFDEYFMTSRSMFTTHGTVYPYDRRVPILIMAPGVLAGPVNRPVAPIDIAPTLAALAGVPYPDDLDGTDLTRLLTRTAD
ncbi:MAG: alkaline phosphatase family protein [Acidobacteriota bacterium]